MKPKVINLVPRWIDLALYAGDGALIRFTINGADINSGEVKAQIRTKREDTDPALEFSVDNTSEPGAVILSLTGLQTTALLNGSARGYKGAWDVEWTPTGQEPVTLVQGKLTVVADVTH